MTLKQAIIGDSIAFAAVTCYVTVVCMAKHAMMAMMFHYGIALFAAMLAVAGFVLSTYVLKKWLAVFRMVVELLGFLPSIFIGVCNGMMWCQIDAFWMPMALIFVYMTLIVAGLGFGMWHEERKWEKQIDAALATVIPFDD